MLKTKSKLIKILIVLLSLLFIVVIFSLLFGSVEIPPKNVFLTILGKIGLDIPESVSRIESTIIFDIRLPRVLLAAIVGGGLATVGAVMQALFKNPLAEPGVLGWSGGGAFAAVLVIYTGLGQQHFFYLPLAAFTGSLIAAFVVYKISAVNGFIHNATLLLSGIAIGSLFLALTSMIFTLADVWSMREMLFWIMGGFDSTTWIHLYFAAGPVLIGCLGLLIYSKELNAIMFGDETAKTLGIDIQKTKIWLIVLSSLVVGACVSVSGVIVFVGLIIPHLTRLVIGIDNRLLVPASFLTGCLFLPLTDLITRTAIRPEELRISIITSLLGVPFFLYLLRKNRNNFFGV